MKKAIILILALTTSISSLNAKTNKNNINVLKSYHLADDNSKIKFTLGSKVFEIQNYNLGYYPPNSEKTNTPTYQSTNVSVGIRASKIDQELLDWIFSENQEPKNAEIVIYDGDSGNVLKTITFTGVTTNNYTENYNTGLGITVNQFYNLSFRYKTIHIKLKK